MGAIEAIMQTVDRNKIMGNFWTKVLMRSNDSKCWNWTGWVNDKKKPYGVISVNKKDIAAHRLCYYLHYGIDPNEMHVLHKCDNPRCVNPNHLFLGTNADNVADKMAKGRQSKGKTWNKGLSLDYQKGSLNHMAKLNEENVLKIRSEYASRMISSVKLSKIYGVSKTLILRIVNRKSWKHI